MARTLKYKDRYCSFRNFCEEAKSKYICCFFCKQPRCKQRCKDYENGCKYALDYDKSVVKEDLFKANIKGSSKKDEHKV